MLSSVEIRHQSYFQNNMAMFEYVNLNSKYSLICASSTSLPFIFFVKLHLRDRYFLTSKPWALFALASTADHGPPAPVPGKLTCSSHHGRLRVRQQRGGGKQRGDGVCSAVLAAAAWWWWQRWQSVAIMLTIMW
jgi:hypothetical protein